MSNLDRIKALPLVDASLGRFMTFSLGNITLEGRKLDVEIELDDVHWRVCEVRISTRHANEPPILGLISDITIHAMVAHLNAAGIRVTDEDVDWLGEDAHTDDMLYLKVRIAKEGEAAAEIAPAAPVSVPVAAEALLAWSAGRRWGTRKDRDAFNTILKRAIKETSG